jgi:two-component system, sensor histidine kinase PdtaS
MFFENDNIKKTILLVEDEPIIALGQEMRLKNWGYNVVKAASGERAVLRVMEDTEIDLVLLDIDLGRGIDGIETARRIIAYRKVPIIFLTSYFESEYRKKSKGIYCFGYVHKSFGDKVLAASIQKALHEIN